jgi:hypothetical protein
MGLLAIFICYPLPVWVTSPTIAWPPLDVDMFDDELAAESRSWVSGGCAGDNVGLTVGC